jgi:hypothetical protein
MRPKKASLSAFSNDESMKKKGANKLAFLGLI